MLLRSAGVFASLRAHFHDYKFRWGRRFVARGYLLAASVLIRLRRERVGIDALLHASRLSDGSLGTPLLKRQLEGVRRVVSSFLPEAVGLEDLDNRCLVLAEPQLEQSRVKKKGVLLVSFSETGGRLYSSADREKLFRLFHLVLEPSWAGYADPAILCWLTAPDPVIVQTPEVRDRKLLEYLGSNLQPVEYGAGDWIDPERFTPDVAAPAVQYNAVSVANFGWWKRNHAFIEAVGTAARRRPDYRAALVLAGLGKSRNRLRDLEALIERHGLRGKLDILEGLGQRELNRLFAYADVLVFTSWKEGSSRVIYEAMCADCPVIVLARNVGVNKNYINEHTGKIVQDGKLGASLLDFNKRNQKQCPRDWFLENVGPANSTRKLATDVARLFPDENWSVEDLIIKGNIPEARYLGKGRHPRPLSFWMSL